MMIGFQVASAAYITDKPVMGLPAVQERKERTVPLKRSIVHMIVRYCALTDMDQHIGPVLRDDGSADDLTGRGCEDGLVGRLGRTQPVKTDMIVAMQRSLVSGF